MADIATALIEVLRTDPVIGPLCTPVGTPAVSRISHELLPGFFPVIAVVPQTGPVSDGLGADDTEIMFDIQSATRSEVATIEARLRDLYAQQWGGSIGSCKLIYSQQQPGAGISKDVDDGPWIARPIFHFQTAS